MRIVVIADTHGLHDHLRFPDGDMLIVAGDFTNTGKSTQVARAAVWLGSLPHKHKIAVAGNHDFYFEREPAHAAALLAERGITYLQDSGVSVEGLLIYGSPWQPAFMNWAFNVPRGRLGRYWEQIPADLDILITHGPPFGVLDQAVPGKTDHVGCEELLAAVEKTKPRVHVFGHIHGSYGTTKNEHTTFYNASLANERYEIVNQAWVVDLERRHSQPFDFMRLPDEDQWKR
jgi:Icc-related predicted phosphoesterase